MAFKGDPKQMIASGESCIKNGPKLIEAFEANVVQKMKKLYEDTGLERFEVQFQNAKESMDKFFRPFSDNIVNAGKGLVSLGEDAEKISKGNMR